MPIISSTIAQDKTVKDPKDEAAKLLKTDPADTIPKTWKLGGLSTLTSTRAFEKLVAGGDKFPSLNSYLNLRMPLARRIKFVGHNNLDLAYGIVNTTSLNPAKPATASISVQVRLCPLKKWNAAALFNLWTHGQK